MNPTNISVLVEAPDAEECVVHTDVLSRIGDKWTVLVIANLSLATPLRYNELRRRVSGISQRMLTFTLKELNKDGLIGRTVYAEVPLRVEYALTDLGLTLVEPLRILYEWADINRPAILVARRLHAEASGFTKAA